MILRAAIFLAFTAAACAQQTVDQRKIWDGGQHNAFTDLVRYKDTLYCAFREGAGHVSPDGGIRILTSKDGRSWADAGLVQTQGQDLRDPHLTVTPNNELMLVAAAALPKGGRHRHQTYRWLTRDGATWTRPAPIGDPDYWLWRVVWHKGKAYGVGYPTNPAGGAIRVYSSTDGRKFTAGASLIADGSSGNETGIAFLPDDTMLILIRREAGPKSALLLSAKPPYTEWKTDDLGVRFGGPQILLLPDGRLLGAGRLYDNKQRTSLVWVNRDNNTMTEWLALPSGGDTSYPGLVLDGKDVLVSYYSSHEGKTSIYFARVALP